MMKELKIAGAVVLTVGAIWTAGHSVDTYFAKQSFVLAGFSILHDEQLDAERRSLNRDIYDLEKALDNKSLSPALKAKYQERLRILYQDREDVKRKLEKKGTEK